jgi:hypothetical protein
MFGTQIENCLFKSYRQYFEASPIFRDMFCLPVPENMLPDGSRKEQPIHVEGIKKADFSPFLTFMNTRLVPLTLEGNVS